MVSDFFENVVFGFRLGVPSGGLCGQAGINSSLNATALRNAHTRVCWWRLREADQFGELAQILSDCRECAFITRASEAAKPQAAEIQIALEMREQHLDLAAFTCGFLESLCSGEAGDMLAHLFMGCDRERTIGGSRALLFERTA